MRDDRELMKLEGAEAIGQLQELANLVKYQVKPESESNEIAVEPCVKG
jgi:roadblock/LC7 domain-containing protein